MRIRHFCSALLPFALIFGGIASSLPEARAEAYDGHPKLVVILVLDQFRGDYLERYRTDFEDHNQDHGQVEAKDRNPDHARDHGVDVRDHGFGLLLDRGAYFPDCYYDYANTETAPGHSAIGTGAYSNGTGINANQWWDLSRSKDHPVTSVEDEHYSLVGLPSGEKATPGSSPRNLLASTLGDELRLATQGLSQVYGISLKDRAAILPAGAAANGAFWIDPVSGRFITSTYYMQQLPDWAEAFDDSGRIAQAESEAGQPNATNFYHDIGPTPAAVSYEFDFAKALITGQQLGKHDTTDLLTLSISSTDLLGHAVGPDSADQRQMIDAVDSDLGDFFAFLDKNVDGGLGNVWIALTGDHGVAPVPATAAALGLNAVNFDLDKLLQNLNAAINLKFSPGEKVEYLLPHQALPYLSLNQPAFERAGINEQEAEDAVQAALQSAFNKLTPPVPSTPSGSRLPPHPVLYRSFTRYQMADGQLPPTPFGEMIANSYSPNGGWYVMVIPRSYQMAGASPGGTTHYSPYSYDRHVPLILYGVPFAAGVDHGFVQPVDIAATFASLLGINQPSASVGHILTQSFKPAAAMIYPKPAPIRPRPRAHHPVVHHHAAASAEPRP